jgi:S-adenosylmethionine uptake transporter
LWRDDSLIAGYEAIMPKAPASLLIPFAVACLGIAVFSTMDAVVKSLALVIGTYNTLLWRGIAGIPLSGLPWLLRRPSRPSRHAMRLHIERGAVTAVMAVLFFWGLVRVPMAQAVALTFIAPLIALILAALLLKEKIGRNAKIGSACGLVGVIVILSGQMRAPPGPEAGIGAIAILLSACCYAYNIILMRRQAQVADPFEVAFFQNVTVTLCLALAAPWIAVLPDGRHGPLLVLGAVLASISLLLLSWAYARAEANYLATVEYTAILWASLYGFWLFGEHLRWSTMIGATLIIGGCLVASRRGDIPVLPGELQA